MFIISKGLKKEKCNKTAAISTFADSGCCFLESCFEKMASVFVGGLAHFFDADIAEFGNFLGDVLYVAWFIAFTAKRHRCHVRAVCFKKPLAWPF